MKENKDYQRDWRKRKRRAGYRPVLVWVREQHKERLKRYIKRLEREEIL